MGVDEERALPLRVLALRGSIMKEFNDRNCQYQILDKKEKQKYLDYYECAYKEDMEALKRVLFISPRWTVIIGYCAMHNIVRYYSGKEHNINVMPPSLHRKSADMIKIKIKDKAKKRKLLNLFKRAERIHKGFGNEIELAKKDKTAIEFSEEIVKPFVSLMENLTANLSQNSNKL